MLHDERSLKMESALQFLQRPLIVLRRTFYEAQQLAARTGNESVLCAVAIQP